MAFETRYEDGRGASIPGAAGAGGRRYTAVAILLVLTLAWVAHARIGATQPPPVNADAARAFVGAQACAPCHQKIHETWTSGRHSKMLQLPTTATVKGDFSKGSVTLHGTRFPAARHGRPVLHHLSSLTGKEQEHRVEYTLGSRRIQHYLTTIEKGMIVVLPPTWDVQRREWLHNMDIVRPDENHQKPVQQWNKDCVGCHVSQQENNYRPATGAYVTTWRDFGTSCERCHGPAARMSRPTRAGAWPRRRRG